MKVEDCFKIGSILKTKGLKGEMQLYVDFDDLDAIKFRHVFIDIAGKLVPYFVASLKFPMQGTAYINLEDVDTIEKAATLVRKSLYLPNKLRPKKSEEEFTLMDLKGFLAVDIDEGELGEISEVNEYPQQIIATVTYKGCEVLFPLNEDIIQSIDVVKNILTVDLPEGLLDIYLD